MKFTGIFLLSIIPVILAFRRSGELRQKQKMRIAFCEFLSHVHFQIENFLRDQKEIFLGFDSPALKKSGFYRAYKERLESSPGGAFGYAWELCGKEFGFDSDTEALLEALARHFGLQEKSAQLAELKGAITRMEERESRGKAECENKVKILQISGITAGLGIMILLL